MATKSGTVTPSAEYTLNESVDITYINKFYEDLKKLLGSAKTIIVDTGNLKRVDTAGMQLLCCWFLEAQKKGIEVTWKNTQGTFANSAKLLGLANIMEINT